MLGGSCIWQSGEERRKDRWTGSSSPLPAAMVLLSRTEGLERNMKSGEVIRWGWNESDSHKPAEAYPAGQS